MTDKSVPGTDPNNNPAQTHRGQMNTSPGDGPGTSTAREREDQTERDRSDKARSEGQKRAADANPKSPPVVYPVDPTDAHQNP